MSETLSVPSSSELRAAARAQGTELLVTLEGQADLRTKATLDELLDRVHALALERRTSEVKLDLRSVEFMNSSCIKSLVNWIGEAQDAAPSGAYGITLMGSAEVHWQTRSLEALRGLADIVRIDVR
jgi:anti-anti-sigma factor